MGKRTEKQLSEPVEGQDALLSENEVWAYKHGKKAGQKRESGDRR